VVVVDRDIAGVTVFDLARRMREGVSDRRAFAVLVPRAFNLVGRRGNAPVKPCKNERASAFWPTVSDAADVVWANAGSALPVASSAVLPVS
jgi:hypothetical protein